MVKFYFKKLFSMLLYIVLFLVIYFLSYIVLSPMANFFHNQVVRYSFLIGIPALIVYVVISIRRINKGEFKHFCSDGSNSIKTTFAADIKCILRSSYFLADIFSFVTIILPFLISLGLESNASLGKDLFAGTVMLFLITGVFFVLDFLSWIIVLTFGRRG